MIESNPPPTMLCEAEPGWLAESPAGALPTARKGGILVVDDQPTLRRLLGIGLREEGFAVWLAANGREALDVYRCHRGVIDVGLLDIHMPDLDGPQNMPALRKLSPQICCCFLTGDLDYYTEAKLRNFGPAALLHNP